MYICRFVIFIVLNCIYTYMFVVYFFNFVLNCMYMGRFMEIGVSNRWLMDISCSEILVIVLYSGSALLGIILIGSSVRVG
ncbi:hypothetical protein HanXRQr2_Chr05g0225691 [Helianthus annuus]|uniref:Uncharacterized protein n=1 Tax=Helianthus annuus TaxID=4232 RepID=A0A251US80_HELAN|nr:hypothetical protein HanXRQr2_Chr05g0225691 [Helianthus annuus]